MANSQLLNSIAQTLGLHDFYQVGLWNYCEGTNTNKSHATSLLIRQNIGYNAVGISECTKPKLLYWFDPVSIILNQLVAGASSEKSSS